METKHNRQVERESSRAPSATLEAFAQKISAQFSGGHRLTDFQQSQFRHGVAFAAEISGLQKALGPQQQVWDK